jgi:hypothetical protein
MRWMLQPGCNSIKIVDPDANNHSGSYVRKTKGGKAHYFNAAKSRYLYLATSVQAWVIDDDLNPSTVFAYISVASSFPPSGAKWNNGIAYVFECEDKGSYSLRWRESADLLC